MEQRFTPIYSEEGWVVWDNDLNCGYRDRGVVKVYKTKGKAQIRAAQCSEKWPSLVRHTPRKRADGRKLIHRFDPYSLRLTGLSQVRVLPWELTFSSVIVRLSKGGNDMMKYLVIIVGLVISLVSPVRAHHEKDPLVRSIKTTSTKDGK